MVFSSITFMFFFFPAAAILYFLMPSIKMKNMLLLISSLLFYAWGEPRYIVLMLFSIAMNYIFGYAVGCMNIEGRGKNALLGRRAVLAIAVAANLLALFLFKYLSFFVKIINHIFGYSIEAPDIELPIGISFYTFQAMSYVIDVYRDKTLVQKNPLHLALYIAFFPQLVAGPIVRYSQIQAEIEKRETKIENVRKGLERLIIGLSKKMLIANIMAQCVDHIYHINPAGYTSFYAWVAAIAYTMQIYYDFSGYSDMAIGMGKMAGFHFLENFNHPYFASSIKDFWRRWHISLSSWFRDYLYIPLGGNRRGKKRTILNKYIVFFLTGLWHGAAVNFIVWGLGHGTLLVIEDALRRNYKKAEEKIPMRIRKQVKSILKALYRAVTLLEIVILWVVFRNTNWKKCIKVLCNMFFCLPHAMPMKDNTLSIFVMNWRTIATMALGIVFSIPLKDIFNKSRLSERMRSIRAVRAIFPYTRCAALFILLIASSAALMYGSYNPFIYFRF